MSRFSDKHRKEHEVDSSNLKPIKTLTDWDSPDPVRVEKIYSYEPHPATRCEKTFYVRLVDGRADQACKVTAELIRKWAKEVPANAVMEPIYKYRDSSGYSTYYPERWAYGVTFTWLVQE